MCQNDVQEGTAGFVLIAYAILKPSQKSVREVIFTPPRPSATGVNTDDSWLATRGDTTRTTQRTMSERSPPMGATPLWPVLE